MAPPEKSKASLRHETLYSIFVEIRASLRGIEGRLDTLEHRIAVNQTQTITEVRRMAETTDTLATKTSTLSGLIDTLVAEEAAETTTVPPGSVVVTQAGLDAIGGHLDTVTANIQAAIAAETAGTGAGTPGGAPTGTGTAAGSTPTA